jgi:hypothetical protein
LLNKTPHTTGTTALSNMSSATSYVSLLANWTNSIEVVRHTLANEWMLELILGVRYHFTCQFPRQLDVLTCLYVFTAANCFFMIANILTGQVSRFSLDSSIFNTVFVLPSQRPTDLRYAAQLHVRSSTTSIFAIAEYQPRLAWVPQTGFFINMVIGVTYISRSRKCTKTSVDCVESITNWRSNRSYSSKSYQFHFSGSNRRHSRNPHETDKSISLQYVASHRKPPWKLGYRTVILPLFGGVTV